MSELQQRVSILRGKFDLLREELELSSKRLDYVENQAKVLERSQQVIQEAAKRTQEQLEYQISELVTLALTSVFPQPYNMVLRFENKRGRTEAGLYFKDEQGNEVSPMEASGYGVVDVASFALRLALWTMRRPKSRATIILDEPFKFVSKDLQPRVADMLRDLSDRLRVQFIIVTHEETLVDAANRVFRVRKNGNESKVIVEN